MGADVSSMDVHRIACGALGDIYGSLGDFPRALENYRSGIQNPSPGFSCGENQLRYALLLSFVGKLNEAKTHLRELITASRKKGFGTLYLGAEMALAIVLAREGHCSEALQLLKITFPELHKKKILRFRTYNDTALFHIALQENRFADAQRHALQLGEYCRSISNPFMELYAYDLLQSANKLSDQPIPLAVDRISQLFNFLDRHITHPDLRPSFLARREAFLNTIGIKLD
jgi:tetratricopeptide (TPR) repeat protein